LVRCRPGWADVHPDRDTHGYAYRADTDAYGHVDRNTYRHADCDAGWPDSHADLYAGWPDANSDTHGDADRDCRRFPRPQPGSCDPWRYRQTDGPDL
jgi:hypothetical protein